MRPLYLPLLTEFLATDTLLYPYGPKFQDRSTPKADDGASPQISISESFYFYAKRYQSLYVNNNGVLSFGKPVSQFTPDPFPLTDGRSFVAPFWADVDNRITGTVYYRESRDEQLLQRVTADIDAYFPSGKFMATWVFVATWDQVAFYGSLSSKVNTFQAVLTSNGELSFVLLNYQDIQWVSGQASGGDAHTGLGGTPAQAGFNNGDAENFFNIPGSWSPSIINISSTSNIMHPGRWAFEVDIFYVPNGCVFKANYLPAGATFWRESDCSQKCQCIPDDHTVRCQSGSCSEDENCQPAFWDHVCQPIHRVSCQVLGGQHLTTFDGQLYRFQGNCTYVLSQLCAPSHKHSQEYYRVEAEMPGAAPGEPSIVRVHMAVYGQDITILTDAPGYVMIDGRKTLLPAVLSDGKVRVRQSGFSVKITVDWGVEVSYDGNQHVEVVVPASYHHATCGLCGTLNRDPSDDFATPRGNMERSAALLAASWQVKDAGYQCGGTRELSTCPFAELANYSSPEHCGILKMSPGPFAACVKALPLASFMESCTYRLCMSGGNRTVLCRILRAYAERCQAANITVGQWRSDTFCGVTCPENSHFEPCASACPASCLDSTAPFYCTEPCRAGCACNRGYILSGGACVPLDRCGCTLNGGYYRVGEEVILTSNCSEKCSCRHPSHPMVCQDHVCGALETCRVVDGVLGCYPETYGDSWVFGDPHYVTFDGVTFDYDGSCRYTLSKSCGPSGQLPDFTIKVENEHRGSVAASWTRRVELEVYGEHVAIMARQYGRVQVNGVMANLPVVLAAGKLYAYFGGFSAIIQTDFGLSISFDWSYTLSVSIPKSYAGSLCGLSGDFNGNRSDDFRTPNGSLVDDAVTFANSWKDADSPFHCTTVGPPVTCSEAELAQYRSLGSCGLIHDPSGPFQLCSDPAVAQVHVENCVREMCVMKGGQKTLCEVLRSYAQQCQRRGVNIQPWREVAGCAFTCLANSHYELCGPSCPASCADLAAPPSCRTECAEGCQCEPGFVLSVTNCVPRELCGCTHNGRYYQPGEVFWLGENCQSFCSCNSSIHEVKCASTSCSSEALCDTQKGFHGCLVLFEGICWASGFLHYITFDGRHFDFQGTCKYILAEWCGASTSVPFFRVEVKNEKLLDRPWSELSEVFVQVKAYQIHLQRGPWGTVKIDGVTANLPVSLDGGDIVIYQHGRYTVLQTRFDLMVGYDLSHSLFVSIPPRYRGRTCGLCGNFNGDATDDFAMQNGSLGEDVFTFAAAWKSETVPGCDKDDSVSYPECPEGEQLIQAKSECWIIQDPFGPFASCLFQIDPEPYLSHCIFDLCISPGNSSILCQSIEKFAAVCQRANLNISAWRSDDFCNLECTAHSHYELCGQPAQDLCSGTWLQVYSGHTCSEGCFCDYGYLKSGPQCVQPPQCGCVHDGRYYKVGEHIWLPGCIQKCICGPFATFRCSTSKCDPDQQCIIKNGRQGCHGLLTTCVVTGDPHYFTFDGAVVHFQGICDYEVSHTCNVSFPGFFFRIVTANRRFRNPRVSFVYRVEIWFSTGSSSVHIVLERGKAVHVNGTRTPLPAQIESIASIFRQRNMLTVRTKANVEIQFNGASSVFIRVGSEYQNQLCGMCGNFNGDATDDKVLPGGQKALNDAEFGDTWVSKHSPIRCKNDTGDLILCPRRHEFEQMCAVLTNSSGPFSQCHWHENPDPYYASCVYDLCQYGLGNRMLCAAIKVYDEMCTMVGVKVPNWRQALGCTFTCPPNQYYDFCGTACPATCAKLDAPTQCRKPCVAGCFCREGYVLNAGVCVPLSQCGCTLNGRYYLLGDEVILVDTCSRKCACRQPARSMECQNHTCGPRELCKVVDDIRGCYPMRFGSMWVYSHPHYFTFDGLGFDYAGACKYTLAKYCGPPGKLPSFVIKVLNAHRASIAVAWTRQVELTVYGQHITIAAEQYGQMQVNGLLVNLPLILPSGKLYAYYSGSSIIVQTDFGLSVAYDWSYYVSVVVPETYSGSLCGLGGDFNGDPSDDFRTPDGSMVHDAIAFGNSWKDASSPFHCTAVGRSTPCNETHLAQYRSRAYCGTISDANGPFRECSSPEAAQAHLENCVKDMCATQGSRKTLCKALRSYAQQCQTQNISIQPWRASTGCELSCQPHSRYELCGSPCPTSCAKPIVPKSCQAGCLEGCQCEPGFVLSGTNCVPREQCGCSYEGRYYRNGELFFREGGSCQKMYRCNGSIHAIDAVGSFCGSGQFCGTQKGVYRCHTQPDAICRVSGFLHYTTFDGRQNNFQGASRYVLAERCMESKSLPSFRVEVKNEKLPGSPLAMTLEEVIVTMNNIQIQLERGQRGTVKIGGVAANVPVQIRTLGTTIYQHGSYATLKMGFGLTVNYDLDQSLFVTLPPEYQGQMCGLCGNFNGLPGDNLAMQNSSLGMDALNSLADWRTATIPSNVTNSTVFEEEERLIRSKSMCWIIQNPDGPFASCHAQVDPEPFLTDCIVDLYASAEDSNILCQSIQTYVAVCQRANVTLSPWRKETFCSPDCPANSHYELNRSPCQDFCLPPSMEPHCLPTGSEGCFCDRGYLRGGDSCIPEDRCGCTHNGLHYKIGERVWLAHCHMKCSCEGPSDFRCVPASCNPGHLCSVKDGRLGCHRQWTTCTITGDPHYFTFDGAVAHFQGTCAYEISRTCHTNPRYFFRVVAQNTNRGNSRVSFVTRVEVWLKSGTLASHIILGNSQFVEVNQERVQFPYTLGPLGTISRIRNMVTIKTTANVEIQYNGRHTLFIHVGPEYWGKLCGMCGNFNGIRGDDKVLPRGDRAQNDSHFGNAWKAETSPTECSDDIVPQEPCQDPQDYEELCGALVSRSGPFAECHWHVDPSPFYSACLYDLCRYGMAHGMLCMALDAYEELCLLHGVQARSWRADAQCPVTDPCVDLACEETEWCGEKQGSWGCFCYKDYSLTKMADYDYRLTCSGSHSTVSLSRCLLFTDGFPAEELHLGDPTCTGTLLGDRLVFYFDAVQQTCGTTAEINATHAIYSNMVQGRVGNTYGGVISRERLLFLRFSCAYPLNINLSMASVIHPIQDVINATLASGPGGYQSVMTLYQDPRYSEPFARSPILLTVNHRAYVGISVSGADPTRFVVTLSSCWATPDRDPSSSIRWDLITNQCPNPRDGTVEVDEDGVSLTARFSFSVFMFIPDLEEVYLHCRVRLCNFPAAKCTVNCDEPGPAIAGRKPPSGIISAGPFLKYDEESLDQGLQLSSESYSITFACLASASVLLRQLITIACCLILG